MSRILIAEDSDFAIKSLKQIFMRAGYTVVAEAMDGEQVCCEYKKYRPDLVTMDITMPVMGGIKAIKNILKEYPDAIIIVISASTNSNIVFEALQAGAKHYIFKPFYPDEIIRVVEKVLSENSKVV